MSYRNCSSCGKSKHYAGWLCWKCRSRERRADPQRRARDREFSRAWKDRNREANRARDRAFARAEENRGRCLTCGDPMGVGSVEDGTCLSCQHEAMVARWERIEAWWAEGLTYGALCARLGFSKGHLSQEIDRMRKAGRAVPHRRTPEQCERIRAGRWEKAA